MLFKLLILGNDSHVDADIGALRRLIEKLSYHYAWQFGLPMRCRTRDDYLLDAQALEFARYRVKSFDLMPSILSNDDDVWFKSFIVCRANELERLQ